MNDIILRKIALAIYLIFVLLVFIICALFVCGIYRKEKSKEQTESGEIYSDIDMELYNELKQNYTDEDTDIKFCL